MLIIALPLHTSFKTEFLQKTICCQPSVLTFALRAEHIGKVLASKGRICLRWEHGAGTAC